MKFILNTRNTVSISLMLGSMVLFGQPNLAPSATASADASHAGYPPEAAIDGNRADWTGWGVPTVDNGEPLFGVQRRMTLSEFVELVRSRVMEAGLENPYIVAQEINRAYQHSSTLSAAGFDALTDYQGGYGGAEASRDQGPTYASATQVMIQNYKDNFLGKMSFVPPHAHWHVCLATGHLNLLLSLPGTSARRCKRPGQTDHRFFKESSRGM